MKNSEAILVTPKHFEIKECPMPEPKENEILMKVEFVGMCGSDIHGFEFGPFIPPKDPNQKIGLGHEVAGEVIIQTSFRYCNNFPQTIEAISSGKFNVKDMVTHIYDYKDVQQAFSDAIDPVKKADMVKGVIKVAE